MSEPNTVPIKQEMAMRGQIIVRTSLVGIVVNLLPAAFKAAAGHPGLRDAAAAR